MKILLFRAIRNRTGFLCFGFVYKYDYFMQKLTPSIPIVMFSHTSHSYKCYVKKSPSRMYKFLLIESIHTRIS